MALITIRIERPTRVAGQRGWRRRHSALVAAAGLAATYVLVGGVAGAAPFANPQVVPTTTIPAHTVLNNATIAAHGSNSQIVLGGATTVPTDATRVKLNVTVSRGKAAGTLNVYPAGNPGGGSGETLSWGQDDTVSGTFTEKVGIRSEITFANNSSGTVVVLAQIVGYSTAVATADITGDGGTPGQVLTNTGNGASWQSMGQAYETTSTGTQALAFTPPTDVADLSLPAGSYLVTFEAWVFSPSAEFVECNLLLPSRVVDDETTSTATNSAGYAQITDEALITIDSTATVSTFCRAGSSAVGMNDARLVAQQVSSATGGDSSP